MLVKPLQHLLKLRFKPDKPLITFTISLVVIPAISGVPVPGAKAGSKTSISIDK